MKKVYPLLISSAVALILAGCSAENNYDEETNAKIEAAIDESKKEGTKENPLEIGETTELKVNIYEDNDEDVYGDASVKISNVVTGEAVTKTFAENSIELKSLDDNLEWTAFDLELTLDYMSDLDYYVTLSDDVTIYDLDKNKIKQPTNTPSILISDKGPSIYEKDTGVLTIARAVPKDAPYIIGYLNYDIDPVYFIVK